MSLSRGVCPKCGGMNIGYQVVQTGSVGASTNRVVIEPARKRHGFLYYISGIWIFKLMWFATFGWWWGFLFGGRRRGGLNFNASKNHNKTMAVCQTCGHTWKA